MSEKVSITKSKLDSLANAIAAVGGTSIPKTIAQMESAVLELTIPPNLQSKTITPSVTQQIVSPDTGYDAFSQITVNAMPSGSATTPATTVTANPSISVNSSTGLITATTRATESVTPTVSAGYVSSGTAGTITVNGSNTSQLITQAAQTIYPSTSDQTIASGKYLTGTQAIKGVLLTNLTAGNIANGITVKVGDSADDDRVASVTGTYAGTVPSGIKYIWTDADGEGPWNVSGYASCCVDGARVNDGHTRVWFNLTDPDSLGVSIKFNASATTAPVKTRIIDWGDGTVDTYTSGKLHSHTYSAVGRYVADVYNGAYASSVSRIENLGSDVVNQTHDTSMTTKVEYIEFGSHSSADVSGYCQNLSTLKKVSFSSTLTWDSNKILTNMFYGCSSLQKFDIPSYIESIGSSAFYDCTSLTSIDLPSGLTSIGSSAFRDCTSLLVIHVRPTTPPTLRGTTVFSNIPSNAIIYVPQGCLNAYQTATNWSSYASKMQEEP